jgi:hypothetical protein
MFFRLRSVSKKARQHPELQWLASMSDALQAGLAVFMTSGAFVGVAFQPMFWNFIAMGVSLNAYMWRVEHLDQPVGVGWRAVASRDSTAPAAAPETPGWRNRTPRPAAPRPLGKSA